MTDEAVRCAAVEGLIATIINEIAEKPTIPSPKSIEVTWVQRLTPHVGDTARNSTFPEVKITF